MNILKGFFTNRVKIIMLGLVGRRTPSDIVGGFRTPVNNEHVGYHAPHFIHCPRVNVSQIRGQDNEPSDLDRKCSRPLRCLHGALFLRLVIHLHNLLCRSYHTMIYTFLIANKNKLANLDTSRTISVCAQSELKARQALNGLPLVFVSQIPSARAI